MGLVLMGGQGGLWFLFSCVVSFWGLYFSDPWLDWIFFFFLSFLDMLIQDKERPAGYASIVHNACLSLQLNLLRSHARNLKHLLGHK